MLRRAALITGLIGALLPGTAGAAPLEILVTNDDGVRAHGIDALTTALAAEPDVRVEVVAPAENQSGRGGLETPGELRASPSTTRSGYPAIAVSGTPADTIRYATETLGHTPDLVISGINDGANLGPVVDYSGTVGAARAAARRGIPALATSQGSGRPPRFADGVSATLSWLHANRSELTPGTAMNLNTPTCRFGGAPASTVAVQPAGRQYLWTLDFLRTVTPIVCPSSPQPPTWDDVRSYGRGYATLTPLPLR